MVDRNTDTKYEDIDNRPVLSMKEFLKIELPLLKDEEEDDNDRKLSESSHTRGDDDLRGLGGSARRMSSRRLLGGVNSEHADRAQLRGSGRSSRSLPAYHQHYHHQQQQQQHHHHRHHGDGAQQRPLLKKDSSHGVENDDDTEEGNGGRHEASLENMRFSMLEIRLSGSSRKLLNWRGNGNGNGYGAGTTNPSSAVGGANFGSYRSLKVERPLSTRNFREGMHGLVGGGAGAGGNRLGAQPRSGSLRNLLGESLRSLSDHDRHQVQQAGGGGMLDAMTKMLPKELLRFSLARSCSMPSIRQPYYQELAAAVEETSRLWLLKKQRSSRSRMIRTASVRSSSRSSEGELSLRDLMSRQSSEMSTATATAGGKIPQLIGKVSHSRLTVKAGDDDGNNNNSSLASIPPESAPSNSDSRHSSLSLKSIGIPAAESARHHQSMPVHLQSSQSTFSTLSSSASRHWRFAPPSQTSSSGGGGGGGGGGTAATSSYKAGSMPSVIIPPSKKDTSTSSLHNKDSSSASSRRSMKRAASMHAVLLAAQEKERRALPRPLLPSTKDTVAVSNRRLLIEGSDGMTLPTMYMVTRKEQQEEPDEGGGPRSPVEEARRRGSQTDAMEDSDLDPMPMPPPRANAYPPPLPRQLPPTHSRKNRTANKGNKRKKAKKKSSSSSSKKSKHKKKNSKQQQQKKRSTRKTSKRKTEKKQRRLKKRKAEVADTHEEDENDDGGVFVCVLPQFSASADGGIVMATLSSTAPLSPPRGDSSEADPKEQPRAGERNSHQHRTTKPDAPSNLPADPGSGTPAGGAVATEQGTVEQQPQRSERKIPLKQHPSKRAMDDLDDMDEAPIPPPRLSSASNAGAEEGLVLSASASSTAVPPPSDPIAVADPSSVSDTVHGVVEADVETANGIACNKSHDALSTTATTISTTTSQTETNPRRTRRRSKKQYTNKLDFLEAAAATSRDVGSNPVNEDSERSGTTISEGVRSTEMATSRSTTSSIPGANESWTSFDDNGTFDSSKKDNSSFMEDDNPEQDGDHVSQGLASDAVVAHHPSVEAPDEEEHQPTSRWTSFDDNGTFVGLFTRSRRNQLASTLSSNGLYDVGNTELSRMPTLPRGISVRSIKEDEIMVSFDDPYGISDERRDEHTDFSNLFASVIPEHGGLASARMGDKKQQASMGQDTLISQDSISQEQLADFPSLLRGMSVSSMSIDEDKTVDSFAEDSQSFISRSDSHKSLQSRSSSARSFDTQSRTSSTRSFDAQSRSSSARSFDVQSTAGSGRSFDVQSMAGSGRSFDVQSTAGSARSFESVDPSRVQRSPHLASYFERNANKTVKSHNALHDTPVTYNSSDVSESGDDEIAAGQRLTFLVRKQEEAS